MGKPAHGAGVIAWNSADLEVQTRRLLREAVQAIFPDRMFHIDVQVYEDLVCDFPDLEGLRALANQLSGKELEWGTYARASPPRPPPQRKCVLALPILPCAITFDSEAEAFARGLEWLARRVYFHGPPRLEGEAERWLDELQALGISLVGEATCRSWDNEHPGSRQCWIDDGTIGNQETKEEVDVERAPLFRGR